MLELNNLKAEDIQIEYFITESQPAFLNQTPRGVRLKHKPTGIILEETSGRSQYQNRSSCIKKLLKILEGLPTQQELFK